MIYDKTTTKYKVSLFLIIKRQQNFFATIGFYALLTTYTTHPIVTNFLFKDSPWILTKKYTTIYSKFYNSK